MASLKHSDTVTLAESIDTSKWNAALPPSGGKAAVHQLVARLRARTHNGGERRGGDREWCERGKEGGEEKEEEEEGQDERERREMWEEMH